LTFEDPLHYCLVIAVLRRGSMFDHGAGFVDTTVAARERAIALLAMPAVGRAARLAAPVSCAAVA